MFCVSVGESVYGSAIGINLPVDIARSHLLKVIALFDADSRIIRTDGDQHWSANVLRVVGAGNSGERFSKQFQSSIRTTKDST